MTPEPMTSEQEHEYYSDPANQVPQGPPVRRTGRRLGEPVPVRFPQELLEQIRQRAAADDRSVSSWIRRAVEHELRRDAS
jgi:predicted HicB family RNase H-like nuclease